MGDTLGEDDGLGLGDIKVKSIILFEVVLV
jgi:hypothetical protein